MNARMHKLALLVVSVILLAGVTTFVLRQWKPPPQSGVTAAPTTSVSNLQHWLDHQLPRGLNPLPSSTPGQRIAEHTLAIQRNPGNAGAYFDRGCAHWEKGEFDKASSDFSMAIRLEPTNGSAFYARGMLHYETREYEKAVQDLTDAVYRFPREPLAGATNFHATLLRTRGDSYLNTGEIDNALADLSEAIRIDPRSAMAFSCRGDAWYEKNEIERAMEDFSKAVQLDPDLADAFNGHANCLVRKREFARAIQDYSAAIRIRPKDGALYYNRGLAFTQKADWRNAINDFTAAITHNPTNYLAFELRASAYESEGDFPMAVADYAEAARLAPDNFAARNSLAWLRATCADASVRSGQQAVETAMQACELSGWKEWRIIGTLAAAYAEAGNFEMAIKYQEQAMGMNGLTDKDRAEEQQRLDLFRRKQPFREQSMPQKDPAESGK